MSYYYQKRKKAAIPNKPHPTLSRLLNAMSPDNDPAEGCSWFVKDTAARINACKDAGFGKQKPNTKKSPSALPFCCFCCCIRCRGWLPSLARRRAACFLSGVRTHWSGDRGWRQSEEVQAGSRFFSRNIYICILKK